ncbi:hypothetical protein ACFE04_027087 [Oxalis oulophora]
MEEVVEAKWSEKVEDLVDAGETDEAITFLETLVSKLQINETSNNNRQLATALSDLATLYNSKHLSLKADALLSRASLLTSSHHHQRNSSENEQDSTTGGHNQTTTTTLSPDTTHNADSDNDDWEAIADLPLDQLLPSQTLPKKDDFNHSSSQPTTKLEAPKRRGRGTFSYNKNKMYCDQQLQSTTAAADASDDEEDVCIKSQGKKKSNYKDYGTRHVLVLADFSPTLRTMDLEKLFADFTDRGVSIRWINDTTALAVFPSPSLALEAHNQVRCPFTVRVLQDDDTLLACIPVEDLEPPRQRPKTSARTAQRLIAHGMGLKLPSTFGSRESKEQEEARRNRIVSRQKLRDDAWVPLTLPHRRSLSVVIPVRQISSSFPFVIPRQFSPSVLMVVLVVVPVVPVSSRGRSPGHSLSLFSVYETGVG